MPTHYWSLALFFLQYVQIFETLEVFWKSDAHFAWQGVSIFDECLIKEQPRLRQLGVNVEMTFRSWLHVEVCTFVHRFHNLLFFAVSY